jgi:cardiolipin synthase
VTVAKERFPNETSRIATLPNVLTLFRLLLVAPFAVFAARGEDMAALTVFMLAGLTDGLDGEVARRLGQESKWGRLADPVADKLLMGVAYAVLAWFRPGLPSIPAWLAWAVIGRDVVILGGAGVVFSATRSSGFAPSIFGKLNTSLEILVVVGFFSASKFAAIQPFLYPLYYLLLASILVSGADYIRQGVKMTRSPATGTRF